MFKGDLVMKGVYPYTTSSIKYGADRYWSSQNTVLFYRFLKDKNWINTVTTSCTR
jgi:hypothetical protein